MVMQRRQYRGTFPTTEDYARRGSGMRGAKRASPQQGDAMQRLCLPVLPSYDDNLAAIKFVQNGSARFAATAKERHAIFMDGYRRWFGKTVAAAKKRRGVVLGIRVRGYYALSQSGIAPKDTKRIFEAFVRWNDATGSVWISVTQLRVLS